MSRLGCRKGTSSYGSKVGLFGGARASNREWTGHVSMVTVQGSEMLPLNISEAPWARQKLRLNGGPKHDEIGCHGSVRGWPLGQLVRAGPDRAGPLR
jgi:hypothetical protein